jgi:predicted nucleotidyltransferase
METKTRDVRMTTFRQIGEAPSLELLRGRRTDILEIADRHGASNVRIYGSVVRGVAGPESDIDMLVDMEDGSSLLDLAALHLELEDLLGFPVEIATDVKPRLRERVHAEAIGLGIVTATSSWTSPS